MEDIKTVFFVLTGKENESKNGYYGRLVLEGEKKDIVSSLVSCMLVDEDVFDIVAQSLFECFIRTKEVISRK